MSCYHDENQNTTKHNIPTKTKQRVETVMFQPLERLQQQSSEKHLTELFYFSPIHILGKKTE